MYFGGRKIRLVNNSNFAYVSIAFFQERALLTYYITPTATNQLSLKFKSLPLHWFRTD